MEEIDFAKKNAQRIYFIFFIKQRNYFKITFCDIYITKN